MCTDSVSDFTQAEHLTKMRRTMQYQREKSGMTEQYKKERPTTSITFPTTVGKNASWAELVAHRASMIKKTQALASLKHPNRWLTIRFEASEGRFSNEDIHCIQTKNTK